ncbi:chitinase-3-like protein 1 isoform X1 [Salvelinus sp. IW2-2015]|uniref:chitinase-3-like protein 1 isoform X1 n=1 Tax=Salvelinus sp. IW2-2015 TaxID=2691554 RepID=UPI000CDF9054|nr:chitinase-like protein 4 isoform X1 [Salvelinus alpinus]XP_023860755.1 chitinase-like protein 4 isoform X1 [Salvelinus alpinus]XP_023860756.1 chitinase-like protein 4 isoform X1 [Salvelinus alpinus]XP_023860757.1 chitinase-like protein 4 isoform X1 [Salvelinus alpinus]XP_023860758.1 chitinase-like protein 4 isoform X1 [Salvelinus alpinus]XP_023860759.1 chitinase-like protein 4 isoform X1 [Salvelinus alpinus]XP_023860760.1 chitinase-like protein 4 isoform X1 [Salvelinus alpinus]XP_02386076
MNVAAVFVWFSLVVTKAICTLEEYRLVCYVNSRTQHHPDMLAFSLDMADPFLCTHIIMAYMDLDQDYHITPFTQEDKTLCNSLNMLKERCVYQGVTTTTIRLYNSISSPSTRNPDLKTLLAFGGRNSTDTRLLKMSSDNTRRKTFVQSVLKHLRQEGFDGLDVVWQPRSASNIAQGGKHIFTNLLKELRGGIQEEARVSGIEALLLSTAVSGLEAYAREAYDAQSFPQYVDFISLVTSDLHGPLEGMSGHISPLFSRKHPAMDTPQRENQVQYWLSQGVDSQKLTLGFPAYSPVPRILVNEINYDKEDTELQEDAGEYTETDTTVRVMAYHEVCQYLKSGAVVKFDKSKKLIEAHEYDHWLNFEYIHILREKMRALQRQELGGAMVWSLDLDDFTGTLCGKGRFPFTRLLKASLLRDKGPRHHKRHHRSRHRHHHRHPHRHGGFLSHDSHRTGYHVHCHRHLDHHNT